MELRLATIDDAERLLAWRNDPVTREFSLTSEVIALPDHLSWLGRVLTNPKRRLYVAMVDDRPVGSLRADQQEDGTVEFSWTIAPAERGRGYGKEMLSAGVKIYPGHRLVAKIKDGNLASHKMAKSAGFQQYGEELGITLWHIPFPQP